MRHRCCQHTFRLPLAHILCDSSSDCCDLAGHRSLCCCFPGFLYRSADLGLSASDVGDAGARERVVSVAKAEARAAGRVIKDDGSAAVAIADFLAQYKLI